MREIQAVILLVPVAGAALDNLDACTGLCGLPPQCSS